jgi:MoxR-like ATPase
MKETQPSDFQTTIGAAQADAQAIVAEVRRVIVGHDDVIEQILLGLLTGGHCLLEGVPGLGKTLLVRTLAAALNLDFGRIQFTPDLMPADITGTHILETDEAGKRQFVFAPGPIFANILLADEINRATPKTQSALLEAMAEGAVSIARDRHALTPPFFVLATQNPIELEGTYPLPEAQLDRFMFKVALAVPARKELVEILDRTTGSAQANPQAVVSAQRIIEMQQAVRQVEAASIVTDAIARLVLATHANNPNAGELTRRAVRFGASPRGGQAILLGAKARALLAGRPAVAWDDVKAIAPAALRHRLVLSFEGLADGVTPDTIITEALSNVTP